MRRVSCVEGSGAGAGAGGRCAVRLGESGREGLCEGLCVLFSHLIRPCRSPGLVQVQSKDLLETYVQKVKPIPGKTQHSTMLHQVKVQHKENLRLFEPQHCDPKQESWVSPSARTLRLESYKFCSFYKNKILAYLYI